MSDGDWETDSRPSGSWEDDPASTGGHDLRRRDVRRAELRRQESQRHDHQPRWRRGGLVVAASAGVGVVLALIAFLLIGDPGAVPSWVDRALGRGEPAQDPLGATGGPAPDSLSPDGVTGAMERSGTGSVTVSSFDGRSLGQGSVSAASGVCRWELNASGWRYLQADRRFFAMPANGAWSDLTSLRTQPIAAARLTAIGLTQAAPLALAADPCRMLALAQAAGVVAESPGPSHFVLRVPIAALTGRDVIDSAVRQLLAAGRAQAVTIEVDLDGDQRPVRIRSFATGVFDTEARFAGWGSAPAITAPSSARPATP